MTNKVELSQEQLEQLLGTINNLTNLVHEQNNKLGNLNNKVDYLIEENAKLHNTIRNLRNDHAHEAETTRSRLNCRIQDLEKTVHLANNHQAQFVSKSESFMRYTTQQLEQLSKTSVRY
ncbi:hypothetical protein [Risungbinella massiliensis]|uniref:hypothetical protein n=1 Tax=Risungbinella massiliensis TaxID=1329796 RepID=UPI0005CC8669|nr:hypothetical protein [Risungbinella massiliensis]